MAVGISLFFVIIYLMSGYAWNICISGNKSIKSSEILSSLNKIGIYEGAKISAIDPEEKRKIILMVRIKEKHRGNIRRFGFIFATLNYK